MLEATPVRGQGAAMLDALVSVLNPVSAAGENKLSIDFDLPERASHLLNEKAIAGLRRAAVLLPVVDRPDGAGVLLTVRSNELPTHPGQISFPGGGAQTADSGPVATALRESQEEIGLAPEQVEVLGLLDDYPTISGYRVTPVVGAVALGATCAADGHEVVEIFEVPLAYLLEPDNYETHTLHRHDLELEYYSVSYDGHFIWGATAGMLRQLMRRWGRAG